MLQEWRTEFNALQQNRRSLMIQLNGLRPDQLDFQPGPAAWSLLQVVEHFMLIERAMIQDAGERLLRPARTVTSREKVMAFVVVCVLKSSLKVKTPASAKSVLPQPNTSLDDVRSQWSRTRDELERLLEGISPDRNFTVVFSHPVSGGMTPSQGLRFIRAHVQHHHGQIDRLIRLSAGAPALTGLADPR